MLSLDLQLAPREATTIYNYLQLPYNERGKPHGAQAFRFTHDFFILAVPPGSHLANYYFDKTGHHVSQHTGLETRLEGQHRRGLDRSAPSAGPDSVASNLSSMKAQDTHDEEDIFVGGQVGHRLDVLNMSMLYRPIIIKYQYITGTYQYIFV